MPRQRRRGGESLEAQEFLAERNPFSTQLLCLSLLVCMLVNNHLFIVNLETNTTIILDVRDHYG
jgi:hypothetical protein